MEPNRAEMLKDADPWVRKLRFLPLILFSILVGAAMLAAGISAGIDYLEDRYDRGQDAFDQFALEEALDLLTPLAWLGYARSQHMVGRIYYYPNSTIGDNRRAIRWLRLSSRDGDPNDLVLLGEVLLREGPHQDIEEALALLRRAAGLNAIFSARAMVLIGDAYANGTGVPLDAQTAIEWYLRAGEDGYGALRIADLYAEGKGVPVDMNQAIEWYRKAAEQNAPEAMTKLGDIYLAGEFVPQSDTMALDWYQASADRFRFGFALNVAHMYALGRGADADIEEVAYWLRRASSLPDATQNPAEDDSLRDYHCLFHPGCVPQTYRRAEAGNIAAMSRAGDLNFEGILVERNYPDALYWYLETARHRHPNTHKNIFII